MYEFFIDQNSDGNASVVLVSFSIKYCLLIVNYFVYSTGDVRVSTLRKKCYLLTGRRPTSNVLEGVCDDDTGFIPARILHVSLPVGLRNWRVN